MNSELKVVSSTGQTQFSQHLRRLGYVGTIEYMTFGTTAILMLPGSTLEEARNSLSIAMGDIDLKLMYNIRVTQRTDFEPAELELLEKNKDLPGSFSDIPPQEAQVKR